MLAPWVLEEMKDVQLQDKRLNDRLMGLLTELGGQPEASIPAACNGFAETAAAYRFFNNEKVSFEGVLQPHIESTYRRMAEHPLVLLVPDTTEIDVTRPKQQVRGAGPLDGGKRFGGLLHPLVGFTPDGTPLGTVYAEFWTRSDQPREPRTVEEAEYERKHTPIEEKESFRWLESYRQACQVAEELPQTRFVCVADSEADIYELIEETQRQDGQPDFVIRAGQDRALAPPDPTQAAPKPARNVRDAVQASDVLFTATVKVRGREPKTSCERRARRQPRQPRTAEVQVRAARVTLRSPWRHDRKLTDVSVNVVLVSEVNPPKNDVPVEWLLVTSLPIETADDVRTVIQYYCMRWMIEIFFRTLKSGCRLEERRFETLPRVERCLAVYLIIAWRTLFVCRMGREFPEASCEVVFEPAEWKSAYQVLHKQPPPSTPPTLQEMVRMVAQLGGYINRKRSDEPGPQTVCRGLERLHDIANCWLLFGPESRYDDDFM